MKRRSPIGFTLRLSIPVLTIIVLLFSSLYQTVHAQVDVVSTGGTTMASYTTLSAAFAAVNTGTHTGVITINITGNTTEPATGAILNASGTGSASFSSVLVRPSGGAARTIAGAATAGLPLIDLNGCDNVTFDGLNSGGNSLTIVNTTISVTSGTSTIRFINDAMSNTLTRLTIQGSSTMGTTTNGGTIFFSTALSTADFGNDNNVISHCKINSPDGINLPAKAIYSQGTTTNVSNYNSGNMILNNEISDFFHASTQSNGIYIAGGSTTWTISNNKFFQTAIRTQTTGVINACIQIANSNNDGCIINGNIMGYASAAGTGVYSLVGVASTRFAGILITTLGAGTPTIIRDNVITAVSVSGVVGGTTTAATLGAILCSSGAISVISNNTIGSLDGSTGLTVSSSSTVSGEIVGIFNSSTTAVVENIDSNSIGSLTYTNSSTGGAGISGIRSPLSATPIVNIRYNTVGSAKGPLKTVSTSTATGLGNQINGIICGFALIECSNNLVRNLIASTLNAGLTTASSVIGIACTSGTLNINMRSNTVHTIYNLNTTAANTVMGIYMGPTAVNTNPVTKNLIHSIVSLSTNASAAVNGIQHGGSGTGGYANNMIRIGLDSAGMSLTNGIQYNGYLETSGSTQFFHNSIYVGGSGVSTNAANTFAFNSSVVTSLRYYGNNIFFNARSNSGSTGKHYAVRVGGTAPNPAGLTINYNDYFVTGIGSFVGQFNGLDQFDLAAWRTAVGQDCNSFSSDPKFINPTGSAMTVDLHIMAGVPTPIEQAGFNLGGLVPDDFDGQTRASLTPTDVGADAGNFLILDVTGPAIDFTPLASACGTGNVVLSPVSIYDASGVPTAGPDRPRIYYRKNMGAWFSNAGVLTSGTGFNGTWSFTMLAADMGGLVIGDIVEYYIIAQDLAVPKNIVSNPCGASAIDVNTIISPPPTLYAITVQNPMSGTFTVGVGGDYTTLTAAVADYNTRCAVGAITFLLTDASYPGETFPISINQIAGQSSVNTLTIRPAAGNMATISGSSTSSIIKFNGADWVTIDGSNSGGTDQSLSIINTSTGASTAAIWVSSLGTLLGATNNVIKNCNIMAGSTTVTSVFGIHVGGTTISTAGTGNDNDNLTIQNNNIMRAYWGIYSRATTAGRNTNTQILKNKIGSTTPADQIGKWGMQIYETENSLISENEVFNMIGGTITNPTGLRIETGVVNTTISKNNIHDIRYTGTGGWGAKAIDVATSFNSNLTISNNFISKMIGDGWSTITSDAIVGIRILSPSSHINIFNNSVVLDGNLDRSGATADVSAALYVHGAANSMNVKSNIFINKMENVTGVAKAYSIFSDAPATAYASINNNDYFVSGPEGVFGRIPGAVDVLNLTEWRNFTGQDQLSINMQPEFVDSTNLHITANPINECLNQAAMPLASVTDDYDSQTRSSTNPDIGADEFTATDLTIAVTETSGIPNDKFVCQGEAATITVSGTATAHKWNTGETTNSITKTPMSTTIYFDTITRSMGCLLVMTDTIKVVSSPNAMITPANQTICAGQTATLTASGGGTYLWSTGATSAVIMVTPASTMGYTVTVTGTGGCTSTATATVTVNMSPNASIAPASPGVCTGKSITLTASGGGTYLWNTGDNTAAISVSPTGTTSYTVTVTAGNGCTSTATTTVTVFPNPTANITPMAPTICSGSSVTLTASGGVSYTWSTGANTTSITVSPASTTTYTVTVSDGNGCTNTKSATVSVIQGVTLTDTRVQPTTCASNDGSIDLMVSGSGGYTYNWFTPDGSGLTQGVEDQTGLSVGTYNVTVTANNGCTGTRSISLVGPGDCGVCPTISSLNTSVSTVCRTTNFTVTASGLSNMGGTYGITFKYSLTALPNPYVGGTILGTVPNAGLTGGGTMASLTASIPTAGNYFLYAILSPSPTDPTCRPFATNNINVLSCMLVVTTPCDCKNNATTPTNGQFNTTVTVNAPSGQSWTVFTAPGLYLTTSPAPPAAPIPVPFGTALTEVVLGGGVSNYVLNGIHVDAVGYMVTVTNGSILTIVSAHCFYPNPTIDNVADTYCVTDPSFTMMGSAQLGDGSGPAMGVGSFTINGNAATVFNPAALGAGTHTVAYTFDAADGVPNGQHPGCIQTVSKMVVINPNPTVNPVPNRVLCVGQTSTQIDFTGTPPGTVYNWTRTPEAIGLAQTNGTGSVPSFIATNAGPTPLTSTFTVTPSFTNAGKTCTGTPITFTITVNPQPTVNQVSSPIFCAGQTSATITFTGGPPGVVFNWTRTPQAIGLAPTSGTGNVPSFVTTNATTSPLTSTFTVTPTFTNGGVTCSGTPMVFTITVNPTPTANQVADVQYCHADNTVVINFSGNVPGTVYNWTRTPEAIGLAATAGANTVPSFVTTNPGAARITSTFTVTPVYTNPTGGPSCPGTPMIFRISVLPQPIARCKDATIYLDRNGNANLTVADVDNGSTGARTLTLSKTTYSCAEHGPNTVILTAADSCGKTSTCQATVTVLDTIRPVLWCPKDWTVTLNPGECDRIINYTEPEATDNCNITTVTVRDSITTAFNSNNQFAGNMFNITNTSSGAITINAFAGNIAAVVGTNCIVSVYHTPTTYVGKETNAAAWTLLGTGNAPCAGLNMPTLFNIGGLVIQPGQTVGIYFALENYTAGSIVLRYTNNNITFSNGDLMLTLGNGKGFPTFTGATFAARYWNGRIHYTKQTTIGAPPIVTQIDNSGYRNGDRFPRGRTCQTFLATDFVGNTSSCTFCITLVDFPNPIDFLFCHDEIQISLDQNCSATINADEILSGGPYRCFTDYVVTVQDWVTGNVIDRQPNVPGIQVGVQDINRELKITVRDPRTGNSCWGHAIVEDKMAPLMVCPRDTCVPCGSTLTTPLYMGSPQVTENCGSFSLTYSDQVTQGSCALRFQERIVRTWTAIDAQGNRSICRQTITVDLANINGVSVPNDFEGTDMPALSCDARRNNSKDVTPHYLAFPYCVDGYLLDSTIWKATGGFYPSPQGDLAGVRLPKTLGWNVIDTGKYIGHPSPFPVYYPAHPAWRANNPVCWGPDEVVMWAGTGYPTGQACFNLGMTFRDVKIDIAKPNCDAGDVGCFKIIRQWTVMDWCTGSLGGHNQIIKVADLEGPKILYPDTVIVNMEELKCQGLWFVPRPWLLDNCSNEIHYSVSITSGVITGNEIDGFIIRNIDRGMSTAYIIAEDCCGNITRHRVAVNVLDNTPPSTVCDQRTIVSITGNQAPGENFGRINADHFDQGSRDNCSPHVFFKAIRMEQLRGTNNGSNASQPDNGINCAGVNGDDNAVLDGNQIYFDDYINFCCNDIGRTIMVVVRVFDVEPGAGPIAPSRMNPGGNLFNRFSDCMVEVEVQDKSVPTVVPPPNIVVSCWFWFDVDKLTDPNDPTFGRVVNDLTFRKKVVTNDLVCHKYCVRNDITGYPGFVPGAPPSNPPAWNRACDFYRVLFDTSHPERKYELTWGFDGTVLGNCGTNFSISVNDNRECGQGQLTRTIVARGPNGLSVTATQIIWVVDCDPFYINRADNCDALDDITWPGNCNGAATTIEGCGANISPDNPRLGRPVVENNSDDLCALISIEYFDELFTIEPDACFKVIRKWVVIDWCQYDPTLSPTNGRWEYRQIIKVTDKDRPVVTVTIGNCNPAVKNAVDNICYGRISLTADATDNCSPLDWLFFDYKIDLFNDGKGIHSGFDYAVGPLTKKDFAAGKAPVKRHNPAADNPNNPFDATGSYPIGIHNICWYVEDGCGNQTANCKLFEIKDCKAPTPYCDLGVITTVMPSSGCVTIWAKDLDRGSFDNCTNKNDLLFYFDGDPSKTSLTVCCEDFVNAKADDELILPLKVYVQDQEGNSDFCKTTLVVQDPLNVCKNSGSFGRITGELKTENNQMTEKVDARLYRLGLMTKRMTTSANGSYFFGDLVYGASMDYLVQPVRTDDPLNGVTTADIVKIQRHILGIESLDSPYKLIAADVNNTKNITAADVSEIRKLILGVTSQFAKNDSWTFVPEKYAFPDVQNPWNAPRDLMVTVSDQQTYYENFIAIKMGDVTNSAKANGAIFSDARSKGKLHFEIENDRTKAGELYRLEFKSSDFNSVVGYQFTLRFDDQHLVFESMEPGVLNLEMSNFGINRLSEGLITTSWNDKQAVTVDKETTLFTLVFRALSNESIANLVTINSAVTAAEAYQADLQIMDVSLGVRTNTGVVETGIFELYQNTPNPFNDETVISFSLPKAGPAKLSLYDLQGKVIRIYEISGAKGINSIRIKRTELNSGGVLYYQLDASNHTATKQMILMD
jgi:trimeric autotransporter adhesin